ncbi:hypothetical protein OROGR_006870 [Orobanche gracilis]
MRWPTAFTTPSSLARHWRALFRSCARHSALDAGQKLHATTITTGLLTQPSLYLRNVVMHMYASCYDVLSERKVLSEIPVTHKDTTDWTTLMDCYSRGRSPVRHACMLKLGLAMHGKGAVVLNLFDKMSEDVKPNITFTAVLSACSHSGLVDVGQKLFYSIENVYGLKPSMENYVCMVDLVGRSGRLEEAESVIRRMPMRLNEVVLGSLLGACSARGQHELGDRLVRDIAQMYPDNTDHHVLVSNMYTLLGKSDKADYVRRNLIDRGIRKVPGSSTMYISGQVNQFSAGESSHPQIDEIYLMLDEMIPKLKLGGYAPNYTSQILSGGDDDINGQEEKERAVLSHSEKLAVCFGLISTKAGTPLYIFKNLKICRDCHSAIKTASKVYDREIVIRDRNRFHSFKNGFCSCSDYW